MQCKAHKNKSQLRAKTRDAKYVDTQYALRTYNVCRLRQLWQLSRKPAKLISSVPISLRVTALSTRQGLEGEVGSRDTHFCPKLSGPNKLRLLVAGCKRYL